MSTFKVREAWESDKSMIIADWLRANKYGHPYNKCIEDKAYFAYQEPLVHAILRNRAVNVLIACLADDPDVALGWVCFDASKHLGHFAYVKAPWRGKGLLNALLAECGELKQITHLTLPAAAIMLKKNLTFNPYALECYNGSNN